jgi:branched-chain amino acid transport system permease protein
MEFWALQILNGITLGMLLFILAAGFTLIFGLMGVLNLAHGSLYLLGAYVGFSVAGYTHNFFLAIAAAVLAVGAVGMLIHWGLLRYIPEHLPQVLLTIGLLFILADATLWIWGGYPFMIGKPVGFQGTISLGDVSFPAYRLLVIMVGALVAVFLWWFQEKTKYGAIIRAGVDNEEMAQGVGINIRLVMTLVFGLGAALAALGGVIGGPFVGIYPGLDLEVLTLALVVVVIGGLGSLVGAFVGALIIGLADNLGKILLPELSLFLIFALMAIILAIRPTGLFGRE